MINNEDLQRNIQDAIKWEPMLNAAEIGVIVKDVFDHIDSLKPWGFLLGNTIPTKTIFSRLVSNKKK